MMQLIQNQAEQPQLEHQYMACQSQTQSNHNNHLQESESEQIPAPETNFRYRRYDSIKILPISSESSSSDVQTLLNFDTTTNINIPTTILREKIQKKKQRIIQNKNKKREKKRKLPLKKVEFMDQQQEWDSPKSWALPEQSLLVNRQLKRENYNELRDSILACIEGKSKLRTIILNGNKETAKKTILFDILNDIRNNSREQIYKFHQYFLTFQEEFNNNVQHKITKFYQFLNNNVFISSNKQRQSFEQNSEKLDYMKQIISHKLSNILIIDDYKSFILSLKQSSNSKKIKKLLRNNTSNLIIFIDSNINKREIQTLALNNYIHININNNSKEYFAISLLTAVNNYPYKNNHWEIMRPLANFFTTQMVDNNKLRLSIIQKLILFLENLKNQSQNYDKKKSVVNREIIEKFTRKFIDRTIKIDLKRLTIQEKAVMSAFYISMKQNLQIFIPIKKVYKIYEWICQSISMKVKPFKEFFHEIIFQLSIYKFIKFEKGKNCEQEAKIMVNIDAGMIKMSLQDEFVLAKFFKRD